MPTAVNVLQSWEEVIGPGRSQVLGDGTGLDYCLAKWSCY